MDGARWDKAFETAIPDDSAARRTELAHRQSMAPDLDELWVANLSYVKTRQGIVFVASIVDMGLKIVSSFWAHGQDVNVLSGGVPAPNFKQPLSVLVGT